MQTQTSALLAQEPPSRTFADLEIKPITQRPCLLMEPSEVPEIRRQFEAMPDRPDIKARNLSFLNALLYGDEADEKKATASFMSTARGQFASPGRDPLNKQRRINGLLYNYDIVASFGYLSKEDQQEFEEDAVDSPNLKLAMTRQGFLPRRRRARTAWSFPPVFPPATAGRIAFWARRWWG